MVRRVLNAWPPVASAALLSLAFPPFNLFLLVFVALVPWLIDLRSLDGRRAIRSGLLFGAVFFFGQVSWLGAFVARWTGSWPLALAPWVIVALVLALSSGLAALGVQRCLVGGRFWLVPVVWAGVEVLRGTVPWGGFPWAPIAHPLWNAPQLAQGAALGTVSLVSAWVVLVNVSFAAIWWNEPFRRVLLAALVAVAMGLGSFARFVEATPGRTITVLVGQTGVDMAFSGESEIERKTAEACAELLATAVRLRVDLLVLPEGLADWREGEQAPTTPVGERPAVPTVIGGKRTDGAVYQSAFAFDGSWSYADKTRLVVFGEYVPGRDRLPFLRAFNLPSGDLTPGDRVTALDVGGVRVGPIICFEALFTDVAYAQTAGGARLLAVLSIDDWYAGSAAPESLLGASVWRAIESGLPLVRSATLGYSAAVDARGRVLARAPFGRLAPLRVELAIPTESAAARDRRLVPWVLLAGVVLALVLPVRPRPDVPADPPGVRDGGRARRSRRGTPRGPRARS